MGHLCRELFKEELLPRDRLRCRQPTLWGCPLDQNLFCFGGGEHGQRGDRLRGVGNHARQQGLPMTIHPRNGCRCKEVAVVFPNAFNFVLDLG